MSNLLERSLNYIRLPSSPDVSPELMTDFSGLRCARTGRVYPYKDGILDLLDRNHVLTPVQQVLSKPVKAWFYDRFRNLFVRRFGMPRFHEEAAQTQAELRIRQGDTVLDLACGHGNFTMEWLKRAGPDGFVIGLDISEAMLRRAANRVQKSRTENVLLVRGDALRLPLATASLTKINCSGGFHQMPNLAKVIDELARVAAPGADLTTSMFARVLNDPHESRKRKYERHYDDTLCFVLLPELQGQLERAGFVNCTWRIPGDWFGYVSAQRGS